LSGIYIILENLGDLKMDGASEQRKLTPKQAKILEFIEKEVSRSGRPPTYREIARYCGYSAVGSVEDHIRALVKKGYLIKDQGTICGLKLAHRAESIDVPILGAIPAGRPVEAIEDRLGSIPMVLPKGSNELFALRVVGESMIEAGILDGDYVIVRKQETAEDGDIVVALIDGDATVKYLEKRRGRLRLLPANPRFSPIELMPGRENLIQGKVIGVQRYYFYK
jgi:repressor LexA